VPSYTAYLIETFVTLLAVCVLAFVVLWGARRLGVGRPSGPIVLQGHLPLDARRAIYLVRVGPQVLIVGAGEGGFTKLGELPASELPPMSMARESSFATVLSRVLRRTYEPSEAGQGEHGLKKHSSSESE
jgi:flagellar biogenesis protein FliO